MALFCNARYHSAGVPSNEVSMILVGIQWWGPEHPTPLDVERVEEILGGAPT